jgi:hypothetical protein
LQVDLQKDCNALCECTRTLANKFTVVQGCLEKPATDGQASKYCTCTVCQAMLSANEEPAWLEIEQQAAVATARGLRSFRKLKSRMGPLSDIMHARAAAALGAGDGVGAGEHGATASRQGRKLHQTPSQLSALQRNVDALTGVQSTLSSQVRLPQPCVAVKCGPDLRCNKLFA